MSRLSIVIPTYNRCETLRKAVSAHLAQTAQDSISEIIIVDDGSTDSTCEVIAALSKESPTPLRYYRQENKGPAAARNVGIREASSEIILFTDDDIIPRPNLVTEHLQWHERFPELTVAVLGNVTWDPEVNPTPFMKWYGTDGALFSYAHFVDRTELDYTDFYTCNVSLKLQFLRAHGTFDEEFKIAAFEDVELGYRLKKAGMRLLYNPNALAYHRQYISFEDACRRTRKAASAGQIFRKKEAGIYYVSCQQTGVPSIVKQTILPFRKYWGFFRKQFALIFLPLKNAMDSRISLPWSVYRIMFRIYR